MPLTGTSGSVGGSVGDRPVYPAPPIPGLSPGRSTPLDDAPDGLTPWMAGAPLNCSAGVLVYSSIGTHDCDSDRRLVEIAAQS